MAGVAEEAHAEADREDGERRFERAERARQAPASRHASTEPPWPVITLAGWTRSRHGSSFSAMKDASSGVFHTGMIAGS